MSLANLIVQPQAAYLYTDQGYYDRNGIILRLEHKIMPFPAQRLAIAMVGAGKLTPTIIFDLIEARGIDGLGQVDFLRAFRNLVRELCPDDATGPDKEDRRFMLGFYSHDHQRAMGLTIFTPDMGPDGKAAYEYHTADVVIAPMVPPFEAFGDRRVNVTVPASFDPLEDGRALVDAQRRKVTGWSHGVADGSRVAGDILLTEVSARGLRFELLLTHSDRMGDKVQA